MRKDTRRNRWRPSRATACVAVVAAILLLAAPLSVAISSLDEAAPVSETLVGDGGRQGDDAIPTGLIAEEGSLPSMPQTEEERQAVLQGYLDDGTLTEEDLSNDFIVESLTGSYLDNQPAPDSLEAADSQDPSTLCANEMDGYGESVEEAEQREQEAAKILEEVQAQAEAEPVQPPAADEDGMASDAESFSMDDELIASQSYGDSDEGDQQAFRTVSDHTYAPASLTPGDSGAVQADDPVPELVLKDVQSIDILSTDGAFSQGLWIGSPNHPEWPGLDTVTQLVYVRMYRTPSFYGKMIKGTRTGDGRYVLTIQLPQGQGEEPRYIDVTYATTGVTETSSNAYPPRNKPVINDRTIFASLAEIPGYDPARDNAYLNAYKLAPFAPLERIVESGNAMAADSPLATKTIVEHWPIDRDKGMKVSLMEGEESGIVRAMVYFSDGTHQRFDVDYLGSRSLIASYTMRDTGVLYQPDFWVLGEGAAHGIDRIASFIRSKTYNNFFAPYNTASFAKMHRTVRDYFDNDIHDRAEEVAANLISNIEYWCATYSDVMAWDSFMEIAETTAPSDAWDSTTPEPYMFNLLFLYTYYERFLNFNIGGDSEEGFRNDANAFLVTAFRGGVIKSGCSLLNMTYSIGKTAMGTFAQVSKVSSLVFSAKLSPYTGIGNAPAFVDVLVKRLSGYTDTADWFADYMSTIAFYHEYKPPEVQGVSDADQLTWRGWDQAKRYPDSLVLWLTIKPGAQYFASTSMLIATGSTGIYEAKTVMDDAHRASYQKRMDNIFIPASQYAVTVASIVGKDRVNRLCVVTFDQRTTRVDTGTLQNAWFETQGLWGKTLTQDPYHKDYTDVTGFYMTNGQGAAAMTVNSNLSVKRIFFLAYTSLGCAWNYYWSHEMAHAIDNDVFLGGDRRGGDNTEDYTDGFLTQSIGSLGYTMNLTYDFDLSSDILVNATRERIYGKENLDDYYSKLYGTMDVLDYAALKAFLRLDKDQQNAVASQAAYDGQNGTSELDSGATAVVLRSRNGVLNSYDGTDATAPVNSSVFNDGTKKFETPEEVYDNQIFLRPGIADSSSISWVWAIYVSDDLRGVWWNPIHCNGNRPDSRSFKMMAYRMLGSDGYDAWANFARSGGGDLSKLKSITGYDSFKEWQMAKWAAIEESKDSFAYVAFDDLVDKFETALIEDAGKNDRNLSQMHSLRTRMLYMMKRLTNDFRTDIYGTPASTVHIRTVDDLRAIADNPFGNYVLDNDIKISDAEAKSLSVLVDAVFYGKFDGNGHSIYSEGEILPTLFKGLKHSYVKDLTLGGVAANVVAASIVNSELENIGYKMFERYVYDEEDLVGMASDLSRGINAFHLMADLDLSEWSEQNAASEAPATAVVAHVMVGTQEKMKVFNGNGHHITGLQGASLFDRVCFADINNLEISDSQNLQDAAAGTYVSLIAKRSYRSQFSDIYLQDVALQGRAWVGFISGEDGIVNGAGKDVRDGGSRFERIQVTGATMTVGNSTATSVVAYAGFICGRLCFSSMEDIYAEGKLTTYGTSCGGIGGAITKSATLNRCISKVDMDRRKAGNNGVLLGDIESNGFDEVNTRVSNCVGLGNAAPASENLQSGRLASLSTASTGCAFVNCYEYATPRYGTSLMGNELADIGYVLTECFTLARDHKGSFILAEYDVTLLRDNKEFYSSLGFSDELWDFEPTIGIGNPMLRFVGDRDAFYDYDIDLTLDYKNECLVISGDDYVAASAQLHNFPYKLLKDYGTWLAGTWIVSAIEDFPVAISRVSEDMNRIDLSETIEYEGFNTSEVERKGSRTVTLIQAAKALGKTYSFERSLEIPPRPAMTYGDRLRGVRADSRGMGAIHFASQATAADRLEYRLAGEEGEGGEWTPITAAVTSVPAGTYDVRIAATDTTFASYPAAVTVEEFDPDTVIFPLVLEPNGGTWAEGYTAPDEYNNEDALVLPGAEQLQRGGYTFGGWYTDRNFSGSPVTEIPAGRTEPQAFYALWKPNTYAVTLHLDGGSLPNPSAAVTQYTAGTGASLPTPVRDYRSFGGWFDNEACEGEPLAAISTEDFGDKELWAKWDTVTYPVTLYVQEGELAEGLTDTFTYEAGVGMALPGADQISFMGHSFKGWFDNRDCIGDPVRSIAATATGPKEFWAKWETDIYAVDLILNKGKLLVGEHDVVSYQYGIEAVLPLLERNGYEFGGWYAEADFSGDPVTSIPVGDVGDKRFWAKWVPLDYGIIYDRGSDGAGDTPPDFDLSAYDGYTAGTPMHLPAGDVMVWPGHTFAGWYESSDFKGSPITEITADRYGDITLYARWMGDGCFLSYYLNGGEFGSDPQTMYEFGDGCQRGDEVDLPGADSLIREGYGFAGWYDNAQLAGDALQKVLLAEGTVPLYAKWTPVEYRITYELNGGRWAAGYTPPETYTVESADLWLPSSDDAQRDGWTFGRWYGASTLKGDTLALIPSGSMGDRTLYAGWDEVASALPPLQIGALTLAGVGPCAVQWDEDGYAKIQCPRSKMPSTAEDIRISVPDGVYIHSITKRMGSPLQFFARLLRIGGESDIWDILLKHSSDPSHEKLYTLEIVPTDESDGGTPSDKPATNPSDKPDNKPNTGGTSAGKPNTGGSNGSGHGTGNGSGNGTGNGNGSGGGSGSGNGSGDGSGGGSGTGSGGGDASGGGWSGDILTGIDGSSGNGDGTGAGDDGVSAVEESSAGDGDRADRTGSRVVSRHYEGDGADGAEGQGSGIPLWIPIAAGAAVLLAAGGVLLVLWRRRRSSDERQDGPGETRS